MKTEEKYLVNEVGEATNSIMSIRANINRFMTKVAAARVDFIMVMKKVDTKNLTTSQKNDLRDFIDGLNYTDLQNFIKEQIW